MNELNTSGLREILDRIPTLQLQQMLDDELQKEQSDPAAVKLILAALEERHTAQPKPGTGVSEEALEKYRAEMEKLFPKPTRRRWPLFLRAASVVLILGALFAAVPQKAEAETFWEMLQRLTNSVIHFMDRDEALLKRGYAFETENEGLQRIYDAVVELGVTEPVVPMWLPDGSELTELSSKSTPMVARVCASFRNDDAEIIYKMDVYKGEPAHQFYRDDTHYETYEDNGVIYLITKNINRWVVVWTKDNIECSISIDCQEDTLRRILKSIYTMEE